MTIEQITQLLGWCAVINIGFLLFKSIVLLALRGSVSNIQSAMTGVSEKAMLGGYVQYISQYKLLIMVFNLAPYNALRFIGV